MKTTVVCGLLGSGKTTFIKDRLQGSREKTVVLVNDFGAAGIDGEVFSADGIESVELPSGCVCCTLKLDLITTIRKIMAQFSPEHLVIEPSGVASPVGVLEALESAGNHVYSVVGIVDVTEFAELYGSGMYGSFFREQIELSDVILANKIDLAEESTIIEAEKLIESINPRAMLFRTKNARLEERLKLSLPRERSGVRGEMSGSAFLQNTGHLHFETLSFELKGNTDMVRFSIFFDALVKGHYGKAARAKALVNSDTGSYRLDGVYGKVDKIAFQQEVGVGRLVIIGTGLDKPGIEKELFGG